MIPITAIAGNPPGTKLERIGNSFELANTVTSLPARKSRTAAVSVA
jgi:hypothetical protein